jgi:exodeoxyribonuclease-1
LSAQSTLYWHDYETFGIDPATDRPAQFAGVRTDLDLNVLGEPLIVYCKLADDYLPSPEACVITGITPNYVNEHGVNEASFIDRIHRELSLGGTCTVGYNNIRFDDEFTRYTLYRNFFDPYAREWKNGNSRWDLLNVVRITRALRPDGIVWPSADDGGVSNKLEHITAANGLAHESAHDALSDVHATIAVAKLIRRHQPRLYDYLFDNRGKQAAASLLNLRERNMLVHSSGMYSNETLNTSLVVPLAKHPTNTNGVIVYDLRHDPEPLIALDQDDILQRVFTAAADLPEDIERVPLKTVHINKCPVIASHRVLDRVSAERIGIDVDRCQLYRERILGAIDEIAEKVTEVFSQQQFEPVYDPDQTLYSGGFFSGDDRRKMDALRDKTPGQLAAIQAVFDDARIPEMLFRYRARNFPESLNAHERARWESFRREKFYAGCGDKTGIYRQFISSLELCRGDHPDRQELFDELESYTRLICPAE